MAHDELTKAARSYLGFTAEPRMFPKSSAGQALLDLSLWLDAYNDGKPLATQHWERVGKVGEEHGEVIGAMIGWGGQNPRKGRTHDDEHVKEELLDVAITALGAIIHLEGNDSDFDVIERLEAKILQVDERRRRVIREDELETWSGRLGFDRRYDYVMRKGVS